MVRKANAEVDLEDDQDFRSVPIRGRKVTSDEEVIAAYLLITRRKLCAGWGNP
jgi:hypothetical protein